MHIAAECQKQGGIVAFVDAEHALDVAYANRLGVQTDNMLLSQPDGGEQALEVTETLVRSSAVDLVIIDSVAALVPRQEIEGNMGDSHVGLQARLMSQALRKLTAIVAKSNTAVIFINQTRIKIGAPAFVNPETTTGGVALKFYSSLRLEVRYAGAIKETSGDAQVIGARTRVRVVKNKLAPPFKTVEFPIIFGQGISHLDILLNMSVDHDIVKKSGSWYAYGDVRLGQGAENSKNFLTENPEIMQEIEDKLIAIISPEEFDGGEEPDEADDKGKE